MRSGWFLDLLLQVSEKVAEPAAKAGEGAAGAGAGGGGGFGMWLPMIGIVAIFYFLIIRPEGKKRKAREAKVRALQKGDKVVTNGGIYGEVVKVTPQDITLEVDKEKKVRIRFSKSAVLDVVGDEAPAAELATTEGKASAS